MGKEQIVRVAAGNAAAPYSGVWRIIVQENEVYLGSSKNAMRMMKVSLHSSGVWVLAMTKESQAEANGNRRLARWERPPQHHPGVTRGPSILIPYTGPYSRLLHSTETLADVNWRPAPDVGKSVELSLYFSKPSVVFSVNATQSELARLSFSNGDHLIVVAGSAPTPLALEMRIAELLRSPMRLTTTRPVTGLATAQIIIPTQTDPPFNIPVFVDIGVALIPTVAGTQ